MTAVSLFSLDLMSYVVAREAAIRARAALMASARRWMSSDDSRRSTTAWSGLTQRGWQR